MNLQKKKWLLCCFYKPSRTNIKTYLVNLTPSFAKPDNTRPNSFGTAQISFLQERWHVSSLQTCQSYKWCETSWKYCLHNGASCLGSYGTSSRAVIEIQHCESIISQIATRKKLSLDEAVAYCLDSDIDSCTGSLTTDEELEIDSEMSDNHYHTSDEREMEFSWVFFLQLPIWNLLCSYITAFTLWVKMKGKVIEWLFSVKLKNISQLKQQFLIWLLYLLVATLIMMNDCPWLHRHLQNFEHNHHSN